MNYAGNLHVDTWKQAKELADSLLAAGKLPELYCPPDGLCVIAGLRDAANPDGRMDWPRRFAPR
ncbi:MAG: hypothetical protein LBI62_03325 [Candidatus Accumulibacter sp.]|jgi:hypothetical protein|nr:hypothetical protein [Accumulibacter sp.]